MQDERVHDPAEKGFATAGGDKMLFKASPLLLVRGADRLMRTYRMMSEADG